MLRELTEAQRIELVKELMKSDSPLDVTKLYNLNNYVCNYLDGSADLVKEIDNAIGKDIYGTWAYQWELCHKQDNYVQHQKHLLAFAQGDRFIWDYVRELVYQNSLIIDNHYKKLIDQEYSRRE